MNEEERWVLNYTQRPCNCCLISVSINIFSYPEKFNSAHENFFNIFIFWWLLFSRSKPKLLFMSIQACFQWNSIDQNILRKVYLQRYKFWWVLQIPPIILSPLYFTYTWSMVRKHKIYKKIIRMIIFISNGIQRLAWICI